MTAEEHFAEFGCGCSVAYGELGAPDRGGLEGKPCLDEQSSAVEQLCGLADWGVIADRGDVRARFDPVGVDDGGGGEGGESHHVGVRDGCFDVALGVGKWVFGGEPLGVLLVE